MIGKEIFPQFTSNILCNRPTLDVIIYNVHLQLSLIDEVQPCHSHMSPYLLLCHLPFTSAFSLEYWNALVDDVMLNRKDVFIVYMAIAILLMIC
jgi:hypothetical protein